MSPAIAWFFGLAFGLTWICWIPAALLAGGATTGTGSFLLVAGNCAPLVATLIAISLRGEGGARARWWRRLTNFGGLASPAGAMCVLLPVFVAQVSLDSYAATGGIDLPGPRLGEAVALSFSTFFFGALPEELAWRGYALPALLRGRDPLAPTLLLAAAWGIWQLPLFFIKGTFQAGIEIGSVIGALFFATLAAQSLLMTAFYLATRCTWAAVLFHWLTALMGEFWQLPIAAEIHRSLWTILLAGLVIFFRPPVGIRMAGAERRGTSCK